MKREFTTPIIKIIEINNADVQTINSGDTFFENELPAVTFGGGAWKPSNVGE